MNILITYTGSPLGKNIGKIFKTELEKIPEINDVKLFIEAPSQNQFSFEFEKATRNTDLYLMFITSEINNKSSEWLQTEYGFIMNALIQKSEKLDKNTSIFIKEHLYIINVEDTDVSELSITDDGQIIHPYNFETISSINNSIEFIIKKPIILDLIANINNRLTEFSNILEENRAYALKSKLRDINLKNLADQIIKFLNINIERLSKTTDFDKSIDTMCHEFIIKTLIRTREDLEGLQGNYLPIFRDYIKEFWVDSIMKEALSVWATNIEDFSKSHGRQLQADLLKAQAQAILKGTQIKRIFIYSVDEIINKLKRKKLFDIMLAQSLLGIEVYAVEDKSFDILIEEIGGLKSIGGGRDFIVINERALYITQNIGPEIQSTKFILPNNEVDKKKIRNASLLFKKICNCKDNEKVYKIEPDIKYKIKTISSKISKKYPKYSNELTDVLQNIRNFNLCSLIDTVSKKCKANEFDFIITLLKKELMVTEVNVEFSFEKKKKSQIETYIEKGNFKKSKRELIRRVKDDYNEFIVDNNRRNIVLAEKDYSEDDILENLKRQPSIEEEIELKKIMYVSHIFENSNNVKNINDLLKVTLNNDEDEILIGLIDLIEKVV